jgi:hypothetical protein
MKRITTIAGAVLSGALALFTFMANQSEEDTRNNVASYFQSPLLSGTLTFLIKVLSSTWFLATSFFIAGWVAALIVVTWREKRGRLSPLAALATEVSLAAYSLDNMSGLAADPATLASLEVTVNKLRARGFAVPPTLISSWGKDKMSTYLHRTAAYLGEGDLSSAKQAAQQEVNDWVVHH